MLLTPALPLLPAGGVGFQQLHTRDITGRDVPAPWVRSPVRCVQAPVAEARKCFRGRGAEGEGVGALFAYGWQLVDT